MNAYQKEALIKRAPQEALIAVMQGQSDDFPQWMAMAELTRRRQTGIAADGVKAQQTLAQGKQSVKDRMLSEMLPEMSGIGQLPAPNMDALAAAQGGVVGYADGGEVERYQVGGYVDPYEEWLATQSNAPGSFWSSTLPRWGSNISDTVSYSSDVEAMKKRQQQMAQPDAAPAAVGAGVKPVKAPAPVKKALAEVSQPKTPVANPTKEEKSNLDRTLADTEKLYDFLDKKFGDQLNPIKEQLERDREAYKSMKSENVGLALLGAAGALLKPGRTTASAIGEGLGTLAEYGAKFQPQLLAARQGISAGEVGLAQAQAQAARGNFGTAAQLVGQDQTRALQEREIAMKEPLYKAQAGYYGAKAGEAAGIGGIDLKGVKAQQGIIQAELKGLQGKVDPISQARVKVLQQQLAQLNQALSGRTGIDLTTGFVPKSGGQVFRSSLFDAD